MPPHAPICDFEGCTDWGSYGFTAPYGHPKPKRPLWACLEHRDWAEQRWRAKYHAGSNRPRDVPMQSGSSGGGTVCGDASGAGQPDLFGSGS